MKRSLKRTTHVIKHCQHEFNFNIPSDIVAKQYAAVRSTKTTTARYLFTVHQPWQPECTASQTDGQTRYVRITPI